MEAVSGFGCVLRVRDENFEKNGEQYGNRIPGVWFTTNSFKIYVGASMNWDANKVYSAGKANQYNWTNFQISQTFADDQFLFEVYRNGEKRQRVVNYDTRIFYNVTAFMCHSNNPAAALIRNLSITTHSSK